VPGVCSLALIANLQNTDAAAGMTKELTDEGAITDQERAIFATFQTSGSAIITNYFSSGAALFTVITIPVITPLAVILVFKFVGANVLRLWIAHMEIIVFRRKNMIAQPRKNIMDMFIDGARRGFTIATTSLLPNVVMAFVIIQALKVTGLLDIVGKICEPIMALWGLPGAAATVLWPR
jgi:spore maturation protein SpmB